jgi:hypothetical protein
LDEGVGSTFVQLFDVYARGPIATVYRIRINCDRAIHNRSGEVTMVPARDLLQTCSASKDGRRDLDTRETRNARSLLERFDTICGSILQWYRILRIHHEWTIFQAVRFVLWLSR